VDRSLLRRRWPVVALVVWSLYVWTTRIVNVSNDPVAATSTKAWAIALSCVVLAAAVSVAVVLVRARRRALRAGEATLVQVVAAGTVVVWLYRGIEILGADYSGNPTINDPAGFKAVHVTLGLISIVFAALSIRAVRREVTDGGDAGRPGSGPGDGTREFVGAGPSQ
jgi:hypothetical protein